MNTPEIIIHSVAPIRICDNGGWTDTWFARHGKVFNIAVSPYVEVQIAVWPSDLRQDRITIDAENYGDRYSLDPNQVSWERHPLLEATIAYLGIPERYAVEINIYSEAPAGASTGTSAAVTVALIGALDQLTPGRMTPYETAMAAQKVETEILGQQCGIQDQLCSAFGGVNFIDMYAYPNASVSQLEVPDHVWWELNRRLVLIYLGRAHSSSAIHEKVIRELEEGGASSRKLDALRKAAESSRDAFIAGDFAALGTAMVDNTEAQAGLNRALVGTEAQQVIQIARHFGVLGWKVNGAGGEGGSVTLLCGPDAATQRALVSALRAENPLFQYIPTTLSRTGLQVWQVR